MPTIRYNITERSHTDGTYFELEMCATPKFPFCIRTFKKWCNDNIPEAVVNTSGNYWGTWKIWVITSEKDDLALIKLTWL